MTYQQHARLTITLGSSSDKGPHSFSFPYLKAEHILVYITPSGGTKTQLTYGTDYSVGTSTVTIDASYTVAADDVMLIKRDSSQAARMVDYTANSPLTESELDTDSKQAFYRTQELEDTVQLDAGTSDSSGTLGDLNDVTLSGSASGEALIYNGTAWVNQAAAGDMTKSVYDTDSSNRVDNAENVSDGTNITSAANVKTAYDHSQDTGSGSGATTQNPHNQIPSDIGAATSDHTHAQLHNKDEDEMLDSGGTYEVTAQEIKEHIDNTTSDHAIDNLSDVDTATSAPSDNQVLTWNNSSSKWVPADAPGSSGGEANTGSNLGTAGVGVFKDKSGVDLRFKKLNSDSSVTITDDTSNDEIDLAIATDGVTNTHIAADAVQTSQIQDGAVTNAKLPDVASNTIKGRLTASSGDVEDLSPANAIDVLESGGAVIETNATTVANAGAIMGTDVSESDGFLRKTGSGTYDAVKYNFSATTSPTATDDTGDGYAVGSLWIDTTNDRVYICLDATASAAVWKVLELPGGGTSGQVLAKQSGSDYDFTWGDAITVTPAAGKIVAGNASNEWATIGPGEDGQIPVVQTDLTIAFADLDISKDATPTLGGDLTVTGRSLKLSADKILDFVDGSGGTNSNWVQLTQGRDDGPTITATGDDTNVDLKLATKGTGVIKTDIGLQFTSSDESKILGSAGSQMLTFTDGAGSATVPSKVDIVALDGKATIRATEGATGSSNQDLLLQGAASCEVSAPSASGIVNLKASGTGGKVTKEVDGGTATEVLAIGDMYAWSGYRDTGGAAPTVGTSYGNIPLDTQEVAVGTGWSLASNEVTLPQTGTYEFKVTLGVAKSGSGVADLKVKVQVDDGAGSFSDVTDSECFGAIRGNGNGGADTHCMKTFSSASTKKVRFQAEASTSGITAERTRVLIKRVSF